MNQNQQPWNGPQQGPGNSQQFGRPQGMPPQQQMPPQGQGFGRQQGMPPQGGPQYGGPGGPSNPQYFGGPATETKPKSKAPLIVGGVLGAGLLVGGGVLAYNWWGGSDSSAATEGIPSDAIAVFELALNPSKDDQLALANIIKKFPAAEAPETTDYKEALWHALTKDSSDAPDYETEIKPWLGDSLSIGVLPGADEVEPVMAIQVTDEDEAKAFAEREFDDETQYFFHDGLMIVHDGGVDEGSLESGSLADNEEYKEDLGELDGGHLATAWFGTGAGELLLEELDTGDLSGTDLEQMEALKSAHGAAALQVEEDLLSINYSLFSDQQPTGTDEKVNDAVAALPGDASIAFSAAFNAEMIDYAWRQLESDPQMTSQLGQFGIASSEDLHALLGNQLTLAVSGLDANEPKFGLAVRSDDIAKHESIVQQALGGELSETGIDNRTDGDTALYAYGYGVDDLTSGDLGDNEAYQSVITEDATSVVFLNAAQLIDAFASEMHSEAAENLRPIHALGMTGNSDGQRGEGQINVSFR